MSWRWLIDIRGSEPKVDWPRLAVVLLATFVVCIVLSALLSPIVFLIAALLLLPLGIWLDVRLRREPQDGA